MRTPYVAIALALVVAFPLTAHADEVDERLATAAARNEEPSPAPIADRKSTWYGWQTLTVDGIATATIAASFGVAGSGDARGPAYALFGVGMGGYVAGGPLVHIAHGEYIRAIGSAVMRAGLPALAGTVAYGLSHGCDANDHWIPSFCQEGAAFFAVAIGMLTSMAIDAGAIAWTTHRAARVEHPPPVAKLTLAPDFAVSPRGASAGVVGQF